MTKSRVIIALDFKNKADVLEFLDKFDEPLFVKVGMELFYGEGPAIIQAIKERGHSIFLDLKLHDIPNTVKGGMKNLANLGVDIVNVHCAGGIAMMKAAIDEHLDQNIGGYDLVFVARGMTPRLKSWQLSSVVAKLFAQAGLPDKAKRPDAPPPATVPPARRAKAEKAEPTA